LVLSRRQRRLEGTLVHVFYQRGPDMDRGS
jgi:hypothetical protein